MPELPEVQATVDHIRERIRRQVITDINVRWARSVNTHSVAKFCQALKGARIVQVFRRAKYIGLELSAGKPLFMFIHLRMSGVLDVLSNKQPLEPHDRVIFHLNNGKSLRFNDTRKFGKIYLYDSLEELSDRVGIEPLDNAFDEAMLASILKGSRRQLKPLLLDQKVIAGLGNIYVDECLWKAKIHPSLLADKISKQKICALHGAIKETLNEAISLLGTDFGDGVVEGGMYSTIVYGRDGQPCKRCGNRISRIVVGQRGTHICSKCQK